MSTTSKISPKKVKRFIGMTVLLIAFSAILIAANRKQSDEQIEGVIVTLKNHGKEENFLRKQDIDSLILREGIDVQHQKLASINVDEIENLVLKNPWVKTAEVFVDNNAKLNVEVEQRSPVARVFNADGNSFYLDSTGFEMPLSERYTYAVPVFTNFIRSANDSVNNSFKKNIVYLSSIIKQDTFWNAQITQVDIAGWNNFDFYTTIGKQKVKFGDTALALSKLNNLMAFYQEVSNKIGWDRYDVLDVRFKGQVIASPSIGWVPPKDTLGLNLLAVVNNNAESPKPVVQTVVGKKPEPVKSEKKKEVPKKPESKKNEKKLEPKAKATVKKEEAKKATQKPKQEVTKPGAKTKSQNDKSKKNNKK